ncbi:MAG TPA: hypothetical protein VKC90_09325 [Chitinophagaceae bacterium]|nr:hypothetical protein [Chitinophagaceae bacterium]
MGKDHRGKPSGINKQEGLGLRPDMPPEKINQDIKMTNKYTTGEDKLAENLKLRHHNRNTIKGKATNAGGYKQ